MIRVVALVGLVAVAAQTSWERAAASAERGNLAAAETEYRQLLAASPDNPAIHYNLGTILVRQGQYDDGRAHLEIAAEAGTPPGDALYNLGNADLEPAFADTLLAERQARLRAAVESYRASLRVNPDDADAKWNLELASRLLIGDPPPSGGGGGGGGGGEGPPQPGERQPSPMPAGGAGPEPRMTEEEAEELLRSAQEREMQVQRDRLKKPQPPGPIRP